jgi:uncharacterized membrane protein
MDSFKGMTIVMLTIISYMVIDSLLNTQLITFILCGIAGLLVLIICKKIKRDELNTFRALLITGLIFFVIGNYLVLTNKDSIYYDVTLLYSLTLGYFLSAIGMIVMFSSIPLIIYKDLEAHFKLRLSIKNKGSSKN